MRDSLLLAVRAIVAPAAGDHDALDRSLTGKARLAFATVYAVLELEEALFSVRVHIIGDGRTASRNRLVQNFLYRCQEFAELIAFYRGSTAARTDSSAEQRFIGIYVSHSAQEFLIQQRALDGSLASAEHGHETFDVGFQGLDSACFKAADGHTQP